jgi:hypothetical protein
MARGKAVIDRSTLVLLIVLMPVVAYGADRPDWAFPVADKIQPTSQDEDQPKTLTGSTKSYTQKQIDDLFSPPDWFPDMHPLMPPVVAHGIATFACASCHLPTGTRGQSCRCLLCLASRATLGPRNRDRHRAQNICRA